MPRECDASGPSQEQFCQRKQISGAILHRWPKKHGMMDEADGERFKVLEQVVSAVHRRAPASQAVAVGQCSQRQARRFFRLRRSTCRYGPEYSCRRRPQVDRGVVDLSREDPEWGADKIATLVRTEGHRVDNARVREVRREEGWTGSLRNRSGAVRGSSRAVPRRTVTLNQAERDGREPKVTGSAGVRPEESINASTTGSDGSASTGLRGYRPGSMAMPERGQPGHHGRFGGLHNSLILKISESAGKLPKELPKLALSTRGALL
ncbi:MAG: hypothetical protein GWO24_08530 [Akkermansiaceae bacterium]|nr:hypothetical protein [Akkermansiaceae bacterium]